MDLEAALRALANERRLEILDWLKDPVRHFRPQVDGDLIIDGVCGLSWSTLKASNPDWVTNNRINVLVQTGSKPQAEPS